MWLLLWVAFWSFLRGAILPHWTHSRQHQVLSVVSVLDSSATRHVTGLLRDLPTWGEVQCSQSPDPPGFSAVQSWMGGRSVVSQWPGGKEAQGADGGYASYRCWCAGSGWLAALTHQGLMGKKPTGYCWYAHVYAVYGACCDPDATLVRGWDMGWATVAPMAARRKDLSGDCASPIAALELHTALFFPRQGKRCFVVICWPGGAASFPPSCGFTYLLTMLDRMIRLPEVVPPYQDHRVQPPG